jgi:hypothetical protein
MADLHVYPDRLEIRLTRAEKVLSLRRDDLVIARDDIKSVAITADPWIWIRGIRAPGAMVPLTLAVGTWKFHGGKDFLLIKGKQRSAVVIDLEAADEAAAGSGAGADASTGFARVIVSTLHASKLIEVLRLVDPDELTADGEAI